MASESKTYPNGRHVIRDWYPGEPKMALDRMEQHIKFNMVDPDRFVRAEVCDNGIVNANDKDPQNYALKFYSKYKRESYWIAGHSTDKKVSGNSMLQALKLMGFDVNGESELYNLPKGKKVVFTKKYKD